MTALIPLRTTFSSRKSQKMQKLIHLWALRHLYGSLTLALQCVWSARAILHLLGDGIIVEHVERFVRDAVCSEMSSLLLSRR